MFAKNTNQYKKDEKISWIESIKKGNNYQLTSKSGSVIKDHGGYIEVKYKNGRKTEINKQFIIR